MDFQPWQNHDDNKEGVRRREMNLPPQYRLPGNQRWLRDALLASMLLAPEFAPRTGDVEQLVGRENKRTEMAARAKFLKQMMTPDQIAKATEVAKDLFSMEILKAKTKATSKAEPRFKRRRRR